MAAPSSCCAAQVLSSHAFPPRSHSTTLANSSFLPAILHRSAVSSLNRQPRHPHRWFHSRVNRNRTVNQAQGTLTSDVTSQNSQGPQAAAIESESRDGKKPAVVAVEARGQESSRMDNTPSVASSPAAASTESGRKEVWLWTRNKDVFTAATEAGFDQLVFTDTAKDRQLAKSWKGLASFKELYCRKGELKRDDGSLAAALYPIANPGDLDAVIEAVPTIAASGTTTVVEFVDWKVIPAENLVAAFDEHPGRLFAVADGVREAIVSFEALERGTDGVVLRTEDPADVFAIKEYVDRRAGGAKVPLVHGQVTRVEPVGMGDRACVDLCSLLNPGEGMLVGSFARAQFLVHSECLESNYVASRPFRVNAGPVHSYAAAPGGKTAYLSELQSGRKVLVVDSQGRTRNALVGRVKIESRPLVFIEAEVDGQRHSIFLQNAETVRLVGAAKSDKQGDEERAPISVSKLKVGDKVLLSIQETAARHTGIKVKEMIEER